MLEHLGIVRQFGMDDEAEVRQVDAAGGDVGRDADPGAPVAQRLERMVALVLAEFARQRDCGEAALEQDRQQVPDGLAGVAEDDGARRFDEAQDVDHGEFDRARMDPHAAILDVRMAARGAGDRDPVRVALVAAGELHDVGRQRRREEQRPPFVGGRVEEEFQVFAEPEVEHLVGLVEDDGPEAGEVEDAALDMVAQAAGRADDDVDTGMQPAPLGARVHAADAGRDRRTGLAIEPGQLAVDLQCKLTGRRDDQRQRPAGGTETRRVAEQGRRQREAVGDRLAGAGLGGDEEIAVQGFGLQDGALDGRRIEIAAHGECLRQGRAGRGECHG